jgi:hypothetical protein
MLTPFAPHPSIRWNTKTRRMAESQGRSQAELIRDALVRSAEGKLFTLLPADA